MCDCLRGANESLGVADLRLVTLQPVSADLELQAPRVALCLERISGSRRRIPTLSATHCPLCGERYPDAEPGLEESKES